MQEENSTENLDALLQQAEIADALQQQILAGDDSDGAGVVTVKYTLLQALHLNQVQKMNSKNTQVAMKRLTLYRHHIVRTRQFLAIS